MDVKKRTLGWFTADETRGLKDFWVVLADNRDELVRELVLRAAGLSRARTGAQPGLRTSFDQILHSWSRRDLGRWQDAEAAISEPRRVLEARGVTLDDWCNLFASVQTQLTGQLISVYGSDATRLAAALSVLQRYVLCTTNGMARGFLSDKDGELVSERSETERARARFSRLMESGLLGVIVCDYQGNILEANDSFLTNFGHSREDLAAGRVRWMSMTPPEWAELDQRAVEQLRETGRSGPWEKEYFHKEGHRIPVLVGVASLSETETIAFVLDISEGKQLQQVRTRSLELEAKSLGIQEAVRLKSALLADRSHALHQPLHTVTDFIESLRERRLDPASEQFATLLEEASSNGQHLKCLISELMKLTLAE